MGYTSSASSAVYPERSKSLLNIRTTLGTKGRTYIFFVTGVVNENQYKYVDEVINVLAVQEIEPDKLVLSTLLNQEQLEEFNRTFEPRSREWRGQYYSLANAIVEACKEYV